EAEKEEKEERDVEAELQRLMMNAGPKMT
ncbi:hypothetical protein KIPB_012972, partial [Kipferlia bialata]